MAHSGVEIQPWDAAEHLVYWQEADAMWLGYLEQHPDYMTQGYTLEELKENLRDIYKDINADIK